MTPHVRWLDGLSVGLSSCHNFLKGREAFHGLIGALVSFFSVLVCSNNEMVFKSRRNRFLIESFHLPPDLSGNEPFF